MLGSYIGIYMLQSVEVKINKLYFAETIIGYKYLCAFWNISVRNRLKYKNLK